MNKKLSPEALAFVTSTHSMYSSFNQSESRTYTLMVEKGHPLAAPYREMRGFFDSLAYACNSSARRFSYGNNFERAEYWAPELGLSWYPGGDELGRFGHIYPSHERWDDYVQAVADAGWPAGASPELHAGSWNIRTQNENLRQAFLKLRDKGQPIKVKPAICEKTETVYYEVETRFTGLTTEKTLALHRKIVALLQKYHKGYVLPARTLEQEQADTAPLPLEQKQFMLGNVKEVTVKERMVLVPLVALPVDQALLLQHVNRIVDLVKNGFPFVQAKDWLEKWLTPAAFRELEQQYA